MTHEDLANYPYFLDNRQSKKTLIEHQKIVPKYSRLLFIIILGGGRESEGRGRESKERGSERDRRGREREIMLNDTCHNYRHIYHVERTEL